MQNYFTSLKIKKAFQFAKEKHAGQKDDTGKDYFLAHVWPVAQSVAFFTDDEDTICAALLHDTIEDTNTTVAELVKEFGETIALLVTELTHQGTKETGYFFPWLHSQKAILVKLADRMSNVSRMETWDAKRQAQYLKRTRFWKKSADEVAW